MRARRIVVVGAGGFGREVHDVIVAINDSLAEPIWDFVGFVDDGQPDLDLLARRGATHVGGTDVLSSLSGCWYVVGVGNPVVRRRLVAAADAVGLQPATLIHPSATRGLDVEIGPGSIICSHVSITTNVRIGVHVHLDQNVAVGHDSRLGDFSRVNPGSTISGDVHLAEDVSVGTNATVIQGLTVGASSTVGAGAAVVRDVPSEVTVVGVPARAISV